MRRFATLLLLLLAGFGLMAGPHPCHAMRSSPARSMPSCHAHRAASGTSQTMLSPVISAANHDCCRDGQGRLCESTCQRAAAFIASISLPVVRSVAPAPRPVSDRSVSSFANPIDHVPLA